MNSYNRYKLGFHGLSISQTIFQKKIGWKLNCQTHLRPDDVIVVTRWNKNKHRTKLITFLENLFQASKRESGIKLEVFLKEKPVWDMKSTRTRKKTEERKQYIYSTFSDNQHHLHDWNHSSERLTRLSRKNEWKWRLLKKKTEWQNTEDEEDFQQLQKIITEGLCLAHLGKNRDDRRNNRRHKTRLGITSWQKQIEKYNPTNSLR